MKQLPLYIFAGTMQQAREYALAKKLSEWRFVGGVVDLVGVRQMRYVKYGTWWDRIDRPEIEAELANRSAVEVQP